MKNKLIRITTIPLSLDKLLEGQLSFMRQHFQITAISSDHGYLKQIGERENVDVFNIDMTRKITPIEDFKSIWKLYGYLKKEKPLIIHSHTPKAGMVSMIAAWLAGISYRLHTVAGLPLLEATGNKRRLLNFVEKITYGLATHIYPNSEGLKKIIEQEKLCSIKKIKVIANGSSNGINTSYFDPSQYTLEQNQKLREKLSIKPDDFVYIFVGRLVSDKGINELTKAFNFISQKYNNLKLLLVGPFESDLDPLKKETLDIINFNKSIITVGYQSDVRPYFAISDALVFPSYREGFPNVVMQAGAMGLPSIVTDINGCNEIIMEGINGTIIPAKDLQALKEKMELFSRDKNLLSKLKSNAREMTTSRYEQKIVWEALLNEYKTLELQHKNSVQPLFQTFP